MASVGAEGYRVSTAIQTTRLYACMILLQAGRSKCSNRFVAVHLCETFHTAPLGNSEPNCEPDSFGR